MLNKIIDLLEDSPTSFNAVYNIEKKLLDNDYKEIDFSFKIEKSGKYYFKKNNSSIIAFNIGKKLDNPSLNIVSSHLDVPSFKIKPNPIIKKDGYVKLNIEAYGGMIMSTWFDRNLSIAGRIVYEENALIKTKIVNIKEDSLIIPNLAIHLNREVNSGYKYNVKDDLLPIISTNESFDFNEYLKEKCDINADILSYDLYLYPYEEAKIWGSEKEFLSSFHIDDMSMAATSFYSFINNFSEDNINVFASFDNEEVGSLTKQGADSHFFYDLLKYITKDLDISYISLLENALNISADNAHALHPNHSQAHDINNRAYLNKGIVIKQSARQSYTSDAISIALFIKMLKEIDVPYQYFTNRSDMAGGSTLGNISNAHVSLDSIDIGLAQLAMHSSRELVGTKDIEYAYKVFDKFYQSTIKKQKEGISIKF